MTVNPNFVPFSVWQHRLRMKRAVRGFTKVSITIQVEMEKFKKACEQAAAAISALK